MTVGRTFCTFEGFHSGADQRDEVQANTTTKILCFMTILISGAWNPKKRRITDEGVL